jgi:hypothetical protein
VKVPAARGFFILNKETSGKFHFEEADGFEGVN